MLKTVNQGANDWSHSMTLGATTVFSSSIVNSLRFAVNKATVDNYQTPFFSPRDIGANIYSYVPGYMVLNVTGGFQLYPANQAKALFLNDTYQLAEDLTLVRAIISSASAPTCSSGEGNYTSTSRANGNWIINGSATGLGLADLLVGRVTTSSTAAATACSSTTGTSGLYAQDAWRVSTPRDGQRRRALGAVLRPERREQRHLDLQRWRTSRRGSRARCSSTRRPACSIPATRDSRTGQTGLDKQWWNLSPRGGVAWDVHGDGRLAVRSSYAMGYDFMSGEYHNINAGAPPFGNRSLIQDPSGPARRSVRGVSAAIRIRSSPDPTRRYVPFGIFGTMDPGINSPRVQSWNVTVEQQLGTRVGRERRLSRQPLRSPVGADRAQPGRLHGPRAVHAQRRVVSGLLDQRQPELSVACSISRTRARRVHRRARSQHRRRLPELPRPEAVGAAPLGRRASASTATTRCRSARARRRIRASTSRAPAI